MSKFIIDKIGHYYKSFDGEIFKMLYRCERSDNVIMLHCKQETTYVFDKYGIVSNSSDSYTYNICYYMGDRFKTPFHYESTSNKFSSLTIGLPAIIFNDSLFKDIDTGMKFKLIIDEIID